MNLFVILIFLLCVIIIIKFIPGKSYESFDAILKYNSIIAKIDLINFFQFIEYYQLRDLDPNPQYQNIYLSDEVEANTIKENIKSILINLHNYVNTGNFSIYDYYGNNKIYIDIKSLKNKLENGELIKLKIQLIQIIRSDAYKKYIYEHKHDIKYRGVVFNPHMMDL